MLTCVVFGFVLITHDLSSHSQEFSERFSDWPVKLRIEGTILASFDEAGFEAGIKSRWIESVSEIVFVGDFDRIASWKTKLPTRLQPDCRVVPLTNLPEPNHNGMVVWVEPKSPRELDADLLREMGSSIRKHVDQGSTVFVVGPVAKYLGRWTIAGADEKSFRILENGWNLVLDSLIVEADLESSQWTSICKSLDSKIPCVAIGLQPKTCLQLRGRKVMVHGLGKAEFSIASCDHLPARHHRLMPEGHGGEIESWLLDLTEWRRDAIERGLEVFPPHEIEIPKVKNGTLMIVGGGGSPKGLMRRFVQAAGGPDKAKLVYVPCSEAEDTSRDTGTLETWNRMGVKNCVMLHTKDRTKANEDPSFYEPLHAATGIWFGGGRQWNLSDSYYGTTTHRLMKEVLARGGVIGGSSAGASIQAKYLARATPIENFRIMAPGYERGGLGFLGGVAIDQHFSQRGRQNDLRSLVKRYPQLLGIGIDEGTALIVKQSQAEIVGRGKVFFYSADPETKELIEQEAAEGTTFDLGQRRPSE